VFQVEDSGNKYVARRNGAATKKSTIESHGLLGVRRDIIAGLRG